MKAGVAGKRHRLISHNAKYIRTNRGTKVLSASDAPKIKAYMLPTASRRYSPLIFAHSDKDR